MLAAITFNGGNWWWVALLAAALSIASSYFAWKSEGRLVNGYVMGFSLRTLGILLLLLCLLDPHWTGERPAKGANIVALVADNSRGMNLSDQLASESRGESLKDRLAGTTPSWLTNLEQSFQARSYRFDRDLRRVTDFSSLDFQGEQSNMIASLNQLGDRYQGLPFAGVALFSDGIATDKEMLEDLNTNVLPPIYPVIIGNQDPLPDISIDRVELRQTAFDDAPISLKTVVSSSALPAQNIDVSIEVIDTRNALSKSLENRDLPASQSARSKASGSSHALSFDWRPIRTGIQFYHVTANASSANEEATQANNKRIVMVNGGQEAFRILYVTGRPNWEYKFLNRALYNDTQLQMSGLIRVARREPKFEFKGRAGESSNPLYRGFDRTDEEETEDYDQPVLIRVNTRDEKELSDGFPSTEEELFEYDAIIIDDLEADFFTFNQQTLIRQFVAQRGGSIGPWRGGRFGSWRIRKHANSCHPPCLPRPILYSSFQ